MKRIVVSVLCLCLPLCISGMLPEKKVQAGDCRVSYQSITVSEGQYVYISLKGDASAKPVWSIEGANIKLHKPVFDTDVRGNPWCCIRAAGTGTGVLKCTVNGKKLTCRIKVLSHAAYVGYFCDSAKETAKEIQLGILKNGKKYEAVYDQFRLCRMESLKGKVKNGVLTLKGLDPGGKPITLTVSGKGKKRTLVFKKTTWKYFTQGAAITLKRAKQKEAL